VCSLRCLSSVSTIALNRASAASCCVCLAAMLFVVPPSRWRADAKAPDTNVRGICQEVGGPARSASLRSANGMWFPTARNRVRGGRGGACSGCRSRWSSTPRGAGPQPVSFGWLVVRPRQPIRRRRPARRPRTRAL
jgi:hypothetical protein